MKTTVVAASVEELDGSNLRGKYYRMKVGGGRRKESSIMVHVVSSIVFQVVPFPQFYADEPTIKMFANQMSYSIAI